MNTSKVRKNCLWMDVRLWTNDANVICSKQTRYDLFLLQPGIQKPWLGRYNVVGGLLKYGSNPRCGRFWCWPRRQRALLMLCLLAAAVGCSKQTPVLRQADLTSTPTVDHPQVSQAIDA